MLETIEARIAQAQGGELGHVEFCRRCLRTRWRGREASDWYALFPNPVVAESILDRLVNSAHHVRMDGRSDRPNKRPGAKAGAKNGAKR